MYQTNESVIVEGTIDKLTVFFRGVRDKKEFQVDHQAILNITHTITSTFLTAMIDYYCYYDNAVSHIVNISY